MKITNILSIATAIFTMFLVAGCNEEDADSPLTILPNPKPLFIVETDIGSSTDDLFALSVLYNLTRSGDCDLKAIMVNRYGLENARLVDIMNTYYGFPNMPIGIVHDVPQNAVTFVDYWKMALPDLYPEEPQLKTSLTEEQLQNLPKAETLYRQILANAPDSSVNVISIGFATNLGRLLQSGPDQYSPLSGVELVKKKVAAMYIQGGYLDFREETDFNLAQDISNAQCLLRDWPTPMFFSPSESGDWVNYTKEMVLQDFENTTDENNPIYNVYAHYEIDEYQRMWDIICVLQAIHPELYKKIGPYNLRVNNEGVVFQAPAEESEKRHYMLVPYDESATQTIASLIRWYATLGPK